MPFPHNIFKMYDIRGVYPDEITESLAYNIGAAFAVFMKQDSKKDDLRLVVCRDMRDSSPLLQKQVMQAMVDQGIEVIDIGLASTPTFYFGVAHGGYDGGIQVTASHNPAQYNGFKMVRKGAVPISGETGIQTIRDIAETASFTPVEKKGNVQTKEGVLQEELAYALSQVPTDTIKPLSVVVDTGNGMGSLFVEKLFEQLPCSLTKMYFELDGSFPNHESNPFKEENNKDIQAKIKEIGADIGIALDGDADRVFFFDETGKTVEPGIVRGILSQIELRDHPGAPIGYDIRPGKITQDMIEEAGGKPFVTRVGHSLIKEKSLEMGAPFAGESSGHFFYKAPFGFFEMPGLIILHFLKEISESGKTVSEYTAPLYKYTHSGEINFDVEDKQAVFDRLKEKYGENLKNDFDGMSFEWEDHWFNVRPSNTENKVRLNLEGVNSDIVHAKVEEVSRVISAS